jgi:hypothetical protein
VAVGCLGVAVLGVTLTLWWLFQLAQDEERIQRIAGDAARIVDSVAVEVSGEGTPDSLRLGDLARIVPDFIAIRGAEDAEEAAEIAYRVGRAGRAGGMSLSDVRSTLLELMPDDVAWAEDAPAIVDRVLADLRSADQGTTDESRDPGAPSQPPETAETPAITDSVALDSISSLRDRIVGLEEAREDAEDELARTRSRLREAEGEGFLGWLWNLIDDLGLGFGWGALYLTITHAWWKGKSVGKIALGIRVVMIDKRPLNWWLSFERAGGYAAGFATGLLGFAQIFWDPNRQAIHDKVSETIVIQDKREPVPGPWIAEGKAQWDRGRAHTPDTPSSPGRATGR